MKTKVTKSDVKAAFEASGSALKSDIAEELYEAAAMLSQAERDGEIVRDSNGNLIRAFGVDMTRDDDDVASQTVLVMEALQSRGLATPADVATVRAFAESYVPTA